MAEQGDSDWKTIRVYPDGATTFTLYNLQQDTEYEFLVYSRNMLGDGLPSPMVKTKTKRTYMIVNEWWILSLSIYVILRMVKQYEGSRNMSFNMFTWILMQPLDWNILSYSLAKIFDILWDIRDIRCLFFRIIHYLLGYSMPLHRVRVYSRLDFYLGYPGSGFLPVDCCSLRFF